MRLAKSSSIALLLLERDPLPLYTRKESNSQKPYVLRKRAAGDNPNSQTFLPCSDRLGTFGRNQHLQQSGSVANASCDSQEWF